MTSQLQCNNYIYYSSTNIDYNIDYDSSNIE